LVTGAGGYASTPLALLLSTRIGRGTQAKVWMEAEQEEWNRERKAQGGHHRKKLEKNIGHGVWTMY
jgi:hypothetical protein